LVSHPSSSILTFASSCRRMVVRSGRVPWVVIIVLRLCYTSYTFPLCSPSRGRACNCGAFIVLYVILSTCFGSAPGALGSVTNTS
jgi:hypothetical protein